MNTAAEPVETIPAEPDLIDRIALALPEEIRTEYYRELLHCRSLPESDEMLRLLRAMQFLTLLISEAPSRVAEERERLDNLLAAAVGNIGRMSAASENYHAALQKRLTELPADIASGISPEAVAGRINENLREEFLRSTIPRTAEDLAAISEQLKSVTREFSITSESLGHAYRGAAEDARKAVASIEAEVSEATDTAARFTKELTEKFSKAYRLSLYMLAGGALAIGLATGMMFERWLSRPEPAEPTTAVVQSAPLPVQGTATPPQPPSGK